MINIISTLPVTIDKKAELISFKTAGARYGLEITQSHPKVASKCDEQILDVIGCIKKNKCKQPTAALIWQGHDLLIEVATPYQTIVIARSQNTRSDNIKQMFIEVRQQRTDTRNWKNSDVVAGMGRQVKTLGWRWPKSFDIHTKAAAVHAPAARVVQTSGPRSTPTSDASHHRQKKGHDRYPRGHRI